MTLVRDDFDCETDDGWRLHVVRTRRAGGSDPSRRPLLIVPGYGMNGFIFGFHPRGTSLEAHLAGSGLEVWTANLRAQGRSRPIDRSAAEPTLERYAARDLPALVDLVLRHTTARAATRVDVLGASLGGSITFAHLALTPAHRIGSVVAVGSPLVWGEVPLVLRVPFASRRVAGALRIRGTRAIASLVLPVVRHAPGLLGMYMNASHVDLDAASELVRTVEDPVPAVNRDIAAWMKSGHLVVGGVDVTRALGRERGPLLAVLSNRDGIVPERVALSALDAWGSRDATTLRIGDDRDWYAHADLFVGNEAPERVFEPIARWLADRGS